MTDRSEIDAAINRARLSGRASLAGQIESAITPLLARAVAAEARAEKAERTLAAIPESPDYRLTMSCCWDARLHYFHTLQGATEEPKP